METVDNVRIKETGEKYPVVDRSFNKSNIGKIFGDNTNLNGNFICVYDSKKAKGLPDETINHLKETGLLKILKGKIEGSDTVVLDGEGSLVGVVACYGVAHDILDIVTGKGKRKILK